MYTLVAAYAGGGPAAVGNKASAGLLCVLAPLLWAATVVAAGGVVGWVDEDARMGDGVLLEAVCSVWGSVSSAVAWDAFFPFFFFALPALVPLLL